MIITCHFSEENCNSILYKISLKWKRYLDKAHFNIIAIQRYRVPPSRKGCIPFDTLAFISWYRDVGLWSVPARPSRELSLTPGTKKNPKLVSICTKFKKLCNQLDQISFLDKCLTYKRLLFIILSNSINFVVNLFIHSVLLS